MPVNICVCVACVCCCICNCIFQWSVRAVNQQIKILHLPTRQWEKNTLHTDTQRQWERKRWKERATSCRMSALCVRVYVRMLCFVCVCGCVCVGVNVKWKSPATCCACAEKPQKPGNHKYLRHKQQQITNHKNSGSCCWGFSFVVVVTAASDMHCVIGW